MKPYSIKSKEVLSFELIPQIITRRRLLEIPYDTFFNNHYVNVTRLLVREGDGTVGEISRVDAP